MVLAKTSAQYKFLQVLIQSYVYMYANMQSAGCMVSPQIFTDCTDYNQNGYVRGNIPYLPASANDLYPANDPDTYTYSDYSTVQWYGFNSKNFPVTNLTTAATAILYAACSVNSTCLKAYQQTSSADQVVQGLVKTNVNSIQHLLVQQPKLYYYSRLRWGQFSQIYQNTPSPGSEIYGLHNGAVYGMAAGAVNASAYVNQVNLGRMLSGGFQMYEALIHTVILGSFSPNDNLQSNINVTGTQVFTHLTDGNGLDTRSASNNLTLLGDEAIFKTKWAVWKAEAENGGRFANEEAIFDRIKSTITKAQPYYNPPGGFYQGLMDRSAQVCVPPDTQQGIDWLGAIKNTVCTGAGALSNVKSLSEPVATALEASARGLLTPQQYDAVNHAFATVFTGQVASMCAGGNAGFPCYPGTSAWKIASGGLTVAGALIDVAEYSNPVGEAILVTNLFCGLSDIAQGFFEQSRGCCASDCNSPSCQSTIGGCSDGTGIC